MTGPRLASKVLLIGWDAADWKFINPLLDAGLMPNLSRLVEGGVIGNLASLRPCLSPILWTSIATGKTADKHGISGFVEPIPDGAGVRPSTSTSRTTKALWNMLSQSGLDCVVVNWYASHPAEPIRGVCVSDRFFDGLPTRPGELWPVTAGAVHPESLIPKLADCRMHPAELSPPDLSRLIPEIDRIDLAADPRPWRLAEVVTRTVSIHSVATTLMEAEPWDFLAVYYDGLDVAGHRFMPYHPPRMATVAENDFRRYQGVMRELYLFHDEMLGTLLDLAGDEATVLLVSDHGFHCDHLRPSGPAGSVEEDAAAWHRHYGVLAMRGPGILADERIYGATLLDVAPTVLHQFGLPVGRDMDGRPLLQAMERPSPSFPMIPSWDRLPGDDGRHPADARQTKLESPAALKQLIALGYLPAATAEQRQAVAIAEAESRFNLAAVHSSHGRTEEALVLLEALHDDYPGHDRYALALARAYADLGQHRRVLAIVEGLEASGRRSPDGDLLLAAAWFHDGQPEHALGRLADCERRYPPDAALFGLIGNLHLARQGWQDAARAFAKALAMDDDDPHSHNGLARAAWMLGDHERAGEHALRAVGLLFFFPQAHFHLGMAFLGMGDRERARRSLKLAVTQAPGFFEARLELENLGEPAPPLRPLLVQLAVESS
ncbi:alkaline phosphatase family protein [Paludisphaera rhizosphaerae]|uniref:alkaline phosphatase family protein n=1 Tax=Paludisphaera rhizosphaerae TaxID=2711216 RepID=UPI0013EA0A66|nr:alkaline phosphatase family protein [Paludisphaera rhizosphaerae]